MQHGNSNLNTLHIFSDGPTTQYKQKTNFYLFSNELSKRGIKMATRNFHESGHGKGALDGVGDTLKRTANRKVLHGKNVTDTRSFKETVDEEQLNISVFHVTPDKVQRKRKSVPSLKSVPGTMKIHQILTKTHGENAYRSVSCTCDTECPHESHELNDWPFPPKQTPSLLVVLALLKSSWMLKHLCHLRIHVKNSLTKRCMLL
jgi:hypothetical protein